MTETERVTDKTLRAWLNTGPVDRGIGTRILDAGAPTVANDALRYLFRMFHFAVKRRWIDTNPASGFEISDAGGFEVSRQRWLNRDELAALAKAMQDTPNFGRQNELAVWLLLALCARKMELLSAQWTEFDLERGVWSLHPSRTKMNQSIDIPLAAPVLRWLEEVQVFSCNSEYLFPARRLIHMNGGVPRRNRFGHISPDTLNVALRRLMKAWRHCVGRSQSTSRPLKIIGREAFERAPKVSTSFGTGAGFG